MVVFECQKCNETVKKPKLAKHLQACNSFWVSCIDCSKVFAWNEWESHTTCISEAQKYQGALYVAKEDVKKGKVKQDSWTEKVQQAVESSSVSPQLKVLLEKLAGFDNIPRKQKPFTNFVKNSLKIWDEKKINEIWEVLNVKTATTQPAANGGSAAPVGNEKADKVLPGPPERWTGWKRALDAELTDAGGELPWKKIRDVLVDRYRNEGAPKGAAEYMEDALGWHALASIPEGYLSEKDELVRLPASA
eukprot:gnl/TRDRNA2_/TRDRNA2_179599_c0_seq1.p1 gnl/TRDRNA2_/TRDRNA2_179599_c0~~gnl/TRDRNA2_/TRDRNA2_179599_c0_seq1.p1  ORF type:complete len:262 (-),score=71.19 gnl/TRDRNA2_/TRDRNA2_179599_c0_seq1:102-845(-)